MFIFMAPPTGHVFVQQDMTQAPFGGAHGTIQHASGLGQAQNFRHEGLKNTVQLDMG